MKQILVYLGVATSLALVQDQLHIFGVADVIDYEPYFREFADSLKSGTILEYVGTHVRFYAIFYSGWIYAIFGEAGYLLIRIINVCLSAFLIVVLNRLVHLVESTRIRRWQVLLVLFLPSYLRFSVMIDRTIFTLLISLAGFSFGVEFIKEKTLTTAAVFVVAALFTVSARIPHIVFVLAPFVGVFLSNLFYSKRLDLRVGIIVLSFMLIASGLVIFNGLSPEYVVG